MKSRSPLAIEALIPTLGCWRGLQAPGTCRSPLAIEALIPTSSRIVFGMVDSCRSPLAIEALIPTAVTLSVKGGAEVVAVL